MRHWVRSAFILSLAAAMTWVQGCATSQSATPYPATSYSSNSASAASGNTNFSEPSTAPIARTFDPSGYQVDAAESKALSDYLTQHKLPLVGAQVMKNPDGKSGVVLYGFVGSDFGKQDAVAKAQKFLGDSSIAVNNRIKVEPQLLTSAGSSAGSTNSAAGSASPDEDAAAQSYPGPDSYAQQQSEAQQYVQQQNSGAAISSMSPLLMLGMMALSMGSGGMFSVGPGSFGAFGSPGLSPFGAPMPYNPYPGFPSPSPYGPGPYNPYGP